ncbi:MAG: ribonuclease E activity regulator RraA [Pseudomonadota bacterium]
MSNNFITPDLFDSFEDQVEVLEPLFKNYGGVSAFGGPVVTVKCHEDNSLVKEQVGIPGKGHVLVVDGGGSKRCALLGDNLAQAAVDNGWAGIIVFGCIRDVDDISRMQIGVQALASHPAKSKKQGRGDLNIAVHFAGVVIKPGHFIYADNNGVLLSNKPLLS